MEKNKFTVKDKFGIEQNFIEYSFNTKEFDDNIELIMNHTEDILKDIISVEGRYDYCIAISELVNNAIKHRKGKDSVIVIWYNNGEFSLGVTNSGMLKYRGDIERIIKEEEEGEIIRNCGRGIFLIDLFKKIGKISGYHYNIDDDLIDPHIEALIYYRKQK